MNQILCFLSLLIILETGQGLICKRCATPTCDTMVDESCPPANADNKEPACLTHIYKDTNKNTVTEKRCTIRDTTTTYDCVAPPNTEKVECKVCNGDFCNEKNGATTAGLTALWVAVVAIMQFV